MGTAAGVKPQNPRGGSHDYNPVKVNELETWFGDVVFHAPGMDIKLIGSQQDFLDITALDGDGSPMSLYGFGATGPRFGFFEVDTLEAQFISDEDFPLVGDWLKFIVGAYYFESEQGFNSAELLGADLNPEFVIANNLPAVSPLLAPVFDLLDGAGVPLDGTGVLDVNARVRFDGIMDTESLAYFMQATADITDWFALTLGARYQVEERLVAKSDSRLVLPAGGPEVTIQSYSADTDRSLIAKSRNFDPKVGLEFRPSWSWLGSEPLVYATYQTATTSATFNVINIYNDPEMVRSTKIRAYEVGLKTSWFDGLLDLNAAVFDYKITDPQVQVVSLFSGGAIAFENAEGQHIQGIEADMLLNVWPSVFNNNLIVTLSGSYLDAIYTSYKNGSGYNELGIFVGGQDYSGNPITRAPEHSYTVGFLYNIPTRRGPIEVGADFYHNAGYSNTAQGDRKALEPAFSTLGANVSFLWEEHDLRLTVYGRNVLDEDYNYSRFQTDFGVLHARAPLAAYGVRLNWDF